MHFAFDNLFPEAFGYSTSVYILEQLLYKGHEEITKRSSSLRTHAILAVPNLARNSNLVWTTDHSKGGDKRNGDVTRTATHMVAKR